LAGDGGPAASLLAFYARLLYGQKAVYDALEGRRLSGALERDLPLFRPAVPPLVRDVAEHGPDRLAVEARSLLESSDSSVDDALLAYWRAPDDHQFFAKAILQPYGESLADAGIAPTRDSALGVDNRCPRCGGAPQLAILDPLAGSAPGDAGSRQLLCATCLTTWPFRRVLCPHCGEQDERKLGYFQSQALDHVRADACESCRRYLKTIDLGRLGLAVPLVDEVAGASLDLWANERGYEKIELNLVGL
jgi:FdhE protein